MTREEKRAKAEAEWRAKAEERIAESRREAREREERELAERKVSVTDALIKWRRRY